jgi:hypothetical protein
MVWQGHPLLAMVLTALVGAGTLLVCLAEVTIPQESRDRLALWRTLLSTRHPRRVPSDSTED